VESQILLGIFPDGRNEPPGFCQRLVEVVVKRRVDHQLPDGSLTAVHPVQDRIELVHCVSQLSGELGILGDHTQAALAGIDVGQQLVRVGYRLVQVVGQRLVLQQFADRTLPLVQLGPIASSLATVSLTWLYRVSSATSLPIEPLPLATVSTSCDNWFRVTTALL
jgi:hypothetical protein